MPAGSGVESNSIKAIVPDVSIIWMEAPTRLSGPLGVAVPTLPTNSIAQVKDDRMKPVGLLTILVPLLLAACASTTVKSNPGKHDKGIRYYRPKPYLVITQAKDQPDRYVDIKLEYHPDFTEEYSIHVHTGIGKNKTSVKLDNGWNLTSIDIDVDSEIPENIKAISDLVGSVGGLVKKTVGEPSTTIRVAANNVPYGYYESVISRGPDGKKHLYGWRYVGFGPFSACPVITNGLECADCHSTPLYALVMCAGVMTFVPLHQAALPPDLTDVKALPAPPDAHTPGPFSRLPELRKDLPPILKDKDALGASAGEPQIDAAYDPTSKMLVVTITMPPGVVTKLPTKKLTRLNADLKAKTSEITNESSTNIRVDYPNN